MNHIVSYPSDEHTFIQCPPPQQFCGTFVLQFESSKYGNWGFFYPPTVMMPVCSYPDQQQEQHPLTQNFELGEEDSGSGVSPFFFNFVFFFWVLWSLSWRKSSNLEPGSVFSLWVFRSCVHLSANHWRCFANSLPFVWYLKVAIWSFLSLSSLFFWQQQWRKFLAKWTEIYKGTKSLDVYTNPPGTRFK